MIRLDFDLLRPALLRGIRESFGEAKLAFTGERLYGYSLCLPGALGQCVYASAQSEEGLMRRVASEARKGLWKVDSGSLDATLSKSCRWTCAEGWVAFDSPFFDSANKILSESFESDWETFFHEGSTRLVYLACLSSLAELDTDGLFGMGTEREGIVLNLWLGDQADEDLLRWSEQVNPYEVFQRYKDELAGGSIAANHELIWVNSQNSRPVKP